MRNARFGHDETEKLPRWLGEEYGWDTIGDVNWDMLRNTIARIDRVLSDPINFPNADVQRLEFISSELFVFLAARLEA